MAGGHRFEIAPPQGWDEGLHDVGVWNDGLQPPLGGDAPTGSFAGGGDHPEALLPPEISFTTSLFHQLDFFDQNIM